MNETTQEPEPEEASPGAEPGPDPTAGRAPTEKGGLAGAAGDEGTSGISTSGVIPSAADDDEDEDEDDEDAGQTPLDQVVEGGARSGWGRDAGIEPGQSVGDAVD